MAGLIEYNANLDVKGSVKIKDTPNQTGSVLLNAADNTVSTRTNAQFISDLNLALKNDSRFHTHTNKSVLDGITSTKVSNWDTAYNSMGNYVPYTGATVNVDLGTRSITSTGGFIGNATTASTLATARTINGTSFNGSANITTANWGTARNITVGNTTKSVNGSGNYSWSLAEMGVSSLIDNIEIGGRNYIREVDIMSSGTNASKGIDEFGQYIRFITSGPGSPRFTHVKYEDNTQYTLSIEASVETGVQFYWYFVYTDGSTSGMYTTISINTATPSIRRVTSAINKTIDYIAYTWGSGGYRRIYNIKLEKGNKHTDWTPAPEDQVSDWNETNSTSYSFIKNKPTIPTSSDYITTNSTQTGLNGNKTTHGIWNFNPTSTTSARFEYSSSDNVASGIRLDNHNVAGVKKYADFAINAELNIAGVGYGTASVNLPGGSTDTSNFGMWVNGINDLFAGRNIYANNGLVESLNGFSKTGATNNDILLGSGGHRPVSDFALANHTHNYITSRNSTGAYAANFGQFYTTSEPAPTDFNLGTVGYIDSIQFGHNGGSKFKRVLYVLHGNYANLRYATSDATGGNFTHHILANRSWVTEQITNASGNYITTNTNQTGLSGNKTTSGTWTFSTSSVNPITLKRSNASTDAFQTQMNLLAYQDKGLVIGGGGLGGHFYYRNDLGVHTKILDLLSNSNSVFYGNVSSTGFIKSGQNDTQMLLAGGGNRPVSDFALASAIPTVNNGQLTLSTGTGLSGSATFTANQSGGSTFSVAVASTHKLPTTAEWNALSTQTLSNSTSNLIVSNTVQRAALTGDVTASQNSNATTIANNAVTHAKYQNIATQRILGRSAAGAGNVQELTLGANLSLSTGGVLSATNTNTTYTAGAGLTLSDTAFSLPVTQSGSGNYVSSVVQTTGGITVTKATLPIPALVTSTSATGTTNVATSNNNTYLNVVSGGVATGSSTKVFGAGSITVASNTSGQLTITGTDTTYNDMSLTELTTGTDTKGRVISAKTLNDYMASFSEGVFEKTTQGGLRVKDWNSTANYGGAIAVGLGASALRPNALGMMSGSTAYGINSLSIGVNGQAVGTRSISIGPYSTSFATDSHNFGLGLINRQMGLSIIGRYNDPVLRETVNEITDDSLLFVIGNGRDSMLKSNSLEHYQDGSTKYFGRQYYNPRTRQESWFQEDNTLVDVAYLKANGSGLTPTPEVLPFEAYSGDVLEGQTSNADKPGEIVYYKEDGTWAYISSGGSTLNTTRYAVTYGVWLRNGKVLLRGYFKTDKIGTLYRGRVLIIRSQSSPTDIVVKQNSMTTDDVYLGTIIGTQGILFFNPK